MRIKKANATHKNPVNKPFQIEYTYHDTSQTDKSREQKLRWETTMIGQLIGQYWEGGRLQMLIF